MKSPFVGASAKLFALGLDPLRGWMQLLCAAGGMSGSGWMMGAPLFPREYLLSEAVALRL